VSALLRRSKRCCTWEDEDGDVDDDEDCDDGEGRRVYAGWLLSLGFPFAPSRATVDSLFLSPGEARNA
jgi:hypothetical protein